MARGYAGLSGLSGLSGPFGRAGLSGRAGPRSRARPVVEPAALREPVQGALSTASQARHRRVRWDGGYHGSPGPAGR